MLAANRKILTVLRVVPTFEVFSVDEETRMLIKYLQLSSSCLKDEEINLNQIGAELCQAQCLKVSLSQRRVGGEIRVLQFYFSLFLRGGQLVFWRIPTLSDSELKNTIKVRFTF